MASRPPSLESLRREIDRIDDDMHDLLMRRTEIVERVGTLKSRQAARLYIRPAREAAILRRLVKRHHGSLPAPVVVRIWREMVAATSLLQGPFSIAVHAPGGSVGYWDLARDQYGSYTQMTLHASATQVIGAVVDGISTVAVLPMPEDGDPDPWWRLLIGAGDRTPRVVARLPFIDNRVGRPGKLGALSIALMDHEESGDDVTLVAVEANAELSRTRLRQAFTTARLPATDIDAWQAAKNHDMRLHLIEIADFVGPNDARVATVEEALGEHISRIIGIGGYATPLGRHDGPGDG